MLICRSSIVYANPPNSNPETKTVEDRTQRCGNAEGHGGSLCVSASLRETISSSAVAAEHVERVHVRAAPPARHVGEDGDGEVQVAVAGGGVPRVAHVADHLAARHAHALGDARGVVVQVRVVVARAAVVVELVDG